MPVLSAAIGEIVPRQTPELEKTAVMIGAAPIDPLSSGGSSHHDAFFFAAQRAFSAATILARPSGLSLRFFFRAVVGALAGAADVPLTFAQRAFAAAASLARTAADTLRLPAFGIGMDVAFGTDELSPTRRASSDWSCWICSAMARARLSWSIECVGILR